MTGNRATTVASILGCLALSSCIFDRGPMGVGEPVSLAAVTVQQQEVQRGMRVPVAPAVRVRDRNGDAVSGLPVAFEVTGGSGTVSVPEAVTDANGVASSDAWTLGFEPGPNRVTATAEGLPPVTFEANGIDPCLTLITVPTDGSVSDTVYRVDCVEDGAARDSLILHIAVQQTLRFILETEAGLLLDLEDVALSDYEFGPFRAGTVQVMLAPGTYRGAVRQGSTGSGRYTLAVGEVPGNLNGCTPRLVTPGVSTEQMVVPQVDCHADNGYFDEYVLHMTAGRTYAVNAGALKLIEVWDRDNTEIIAGNAGMPGFPVAVTPAVTGDYRIRVILPSPDQSWRYTFSVQ